MQRIARMLAFRLPLLAVPLSITTAAAPGLAQPVQVLHRFTESPANPTGPLVSTPDGSFFGPTLTGIIRLSTGGEVTQVARLADASPLGALVLASDGALYGTARSTLPLPLGRGSIFRFDRVTHVVRTIHQFQSPGEGRDPLGGLVAVGGSLYGVTRNGPGTHDNGTIFHVVVATGQVVTDYVFPAAPTAAPRQPSSPLVLAPDGFLYGTSDHPGGGAIYRFDPVSGTLTLRHELTTADGVGPGALLLGGDGNLYGTASSGGTESAGTIFRYAPTSDTFERLYSLTPSNTTDGVGPGPLAAGGDGHLYGVTDARFTAPSTSTWTVFRLRAGAGGTFTYETLRTLDGDAAGTPSRSGLARGINGLLYGTATYGGPTLAGTDSEAVLGGPTGPPGHGTIFRFDPAETAPPPNAIAFTLVHTFPFLSTWQPSAPVQAQDGLLYGLTSAGGSMNRGAVYRLDPASGAVTILSEVPGALTGQTTNSSLVVGPDSLLYGISRTSVPSPVEQRIVRVTPAGGTAAFVPNAAAPNELVGSPPVGLYGIGPAPVDGFARFDPAANQLVVLSANLPGTGPTPVTVTADGQVYALRQRGDWTTLFRLTQTLPNRFDEVVLTGVLAFDRLVEGTTGVLYLAAAYAGGWAVVSVDRASGAQALVCSLPQPVGWVRSLSVGPDSALYGVITSASQRLFRCDPATGALTVTPLPADFGVVTGRLVTVGGMLYGAAGPSPGSGGVLFRLAPGGTLPALDSDGDGLPNTWETAYRLDPFATGAGSGAADDPDGDGRTNAEELAAGTHPRGFVRRLFAEGATGPFFRTRFDITAPGVAATVRARFLTDTGAVVGTDLLVPALSHVAFDPATLPGLAHASFSTIVESDADVAVDRTMSWDPSGYGSHLETGIAAPSTSWFFAEGATAGDFALFYLLQNPNATAVTATVTYLREAGSPIVRQYTLPANSRTTIVVDGEAPELADAAVSAAITATAPIVAERAMYLSRPGQVFAAGHESAGVTAPALEWFFAEGATGAFFDLFVLIANPGSTPATVEVEYLRPSGAPLTKAYTVPAQSRRTIFVDDEEFPAGSGLKTLASAAVSTVVRSTNNVPIVVERAMWWPGPTVTSSYWYEAHNSPGATGTATRWVLGGAEVRGVDGADTFVLIANTTATAGRAEVSIVGDDYIVGTLTVDLPARSRTTVSLAGSFPTNPLAGRVGVIVESVGATPVPIVVERATYSSPGGAFWSSGGNALATPLP